MCVAIEVWGGNFVGALDSNTVWPFEEALRFGGGRNSGDGCMGRAPELVVNGARCTNPERVRIRLTVSTVLLARSLEVSPGPARGGRPGLISGKSSKAFASSVVRLWA